jgi:hypothetical protein
LALGVGVIVPSAALAVSVPPVLASETKAVEVVRVSAPRGFDWTDAGIGAAGGFGLSMLAIGGGLVIDGIRRQTRATSEPGRDRTSNEQAAGDPGEDWDFEPRPRH